MSSYKKDLVYELKKDLDFKQRLRTEFGEELHGPDEEEFEIEEKIQELENRDQFGIPRW